MTIYEKIYKVMSEIQAVHRDKSIQTSKGAYSVTTYESLLRVVRPKLIENKLVLIRTSARARLEGNICILDAEYDLVDLDSGDKVHMASIGAGHDTSDKHAGKAMTYSMKYMLRDLFLLFSTDDDPDLMSSEENAKRDIESKLTNASVCARVDAAHAKGIINDTDSGSLIASIKQCGENKSDLEKASQYISSTLGV